MHTSHHVQLVFRARFRRVGVPLARKNGVRGVWHANGTNWHARGGEGGEASQKWGVWGAKPPKKFFGACEDPAI